MRFTVAGQWQIDGARFVALTSESPFGHHEAAVQVERGGKLSPVLKLYEQGYPDSATALAAAREVLQLCCGMPNDVK